MCFMPLLCPCSPPDKELARLLRPMNWTLQRPDMGFQWRHLDQELSGDTKGEGMKREIYLQERNLSLGGQ
ncbi:hypothetical protein AKJ16_DCAP18438 [Drosera capensis]